ncbi:hypothetical protein D0B54_02125 [Solimonas sp. K1W22B-7]|nr:hypothetical protein D0B54_02125 [Solimonas sp. K1W22B-7]
MLFLLWPAWAAAVDRVSLSVGRIEGAGWNASGLQAGMDAGGRVSVAVARLESAALPGPVKQFQASCRIGRGEGRAMSCREGRLALAADKLGSLGGDFTVDAPSAADWRLRSRLRGELSGQDASERYVAEKMVFGLDADLRLQGGRLRGSTGLQLSSGQAYADPVFADFSAHPLRAQAEWSLALPSRLLDLQALELEQPGIGRIRAQGRWPLREGVKGLAAVVDIAALELAPAAEWYAKPFLAGSRMSDLVASGQARGRVELHAGAPAVVALDLADAGLDLGKLGLGFEGLQGRFAWTANAASAQDAVLQIGQLRYGKLESAPATLRYRAGGRDFRLAAPLRLGLLDGALNIRQLELRNAGQPGMGAAFDADIELIELAQLCRAFGWPEFSGTLAGRLPGVKLENDILSLDGALTARAFDGDIRIGDLRVIQPFGVLPRVAADIRLRKLDLKQVTSAFSFGRIEGRLNGDVGGLRLIGWKPVAMDAHLYTPADDRSRHRISQRAIDSISRAGGGPAGLLKRSALTVFEDFAYDRIGWSCQLDNGVCIMDGLEPAKNGGYVLVKGRLLPRIDVVGYSRRVGWETFLGQLKAAMAAEKAEVR